MSSCKLLHNYLVLGVLEMYLRKVPELDEVKSNNHQLRRSLHIPPNEIQSFTRLAVGISGALLRILEIPIPNNILVKFSGFWRLFRGFLTFIQFPETSKFGC